MSSQATPRSTITPKLLMPCPKLISNSVTLNGGDTLFFTTFNPNPVSNWGVSLFDGGNAANIKAYARIVFRALPPVVTSGLPKGNQFYAATG